jgi:hypothetical protein
MDDLVELSFVPFPLSARLLDADGNRFEKDDEVDEKKKSDEQGDPPIDP